MVLFAQETLLYILHNVNQETLKNCLVVSKDFYGPAQEALYNNVSACIMKDDVFPFSTFLKWAMDNLGRARRIKRLKLAGTAERLTDGDAHQYLTLNILSLLLDHLPCLRSLELSKLYWNPCPDCVTCSSDFKHLSLHTITFTSVNFNSTSASAFDIASCAISPVDIVVNDCFSDFDVTDVSSHPSIRPIHIFSLSITSAEFSAKYVVPRLEPGITSMKFDRLTGRNGPWVKKLFLAQRDSLRSLYLVSGYPNAYQARSLPAAAMGLDVLNLESMTIELAVASTSFYPAQFYSSHFAYVIDALKCVGKSPETLTLIIVLRDKLSNRDTHEVFSTIHWSLIGEQVGKFTALKRLEIQVRHKKNTGTIIWTTRRIKRITDLLNCPNNIKPVIMEVKAGEIPSILQQHVEF